MVSEDERGGLNYWRAGLSDTVAAHSVIITATGDTGPGPVLPTRSNLVPWDAGALPPGSGEEETLLSHLPRVTSLLEC